MEQNREPRTRPTCIVNWFVTKAHRQCNRYRIVFSTYRGSTVGNHMQEKTQAQSLNLSHTKKRSSKWILVLNVKCKPVEFLQNRRKYVTLNLVMNFKTWQENTMPKNIDKLDFIKFLLFRRQENEKISHGLGENIWKTSVYQTDLDLCPNYMNYS